MRAAMMRTWPALRCSQRKYNVTSASRTFSTLKNEDFYKIAETPDSAKFGTFVRGEIIDQSIDLRLVRPGDIIDVPYEFTINESFRDFWQSGFYSYDRINTSTPFAHSLGLQGQVLPFNLMLFLSASMSHVDRAKLQIGFHNAIYHQPAYSGDTFKKRYIVRSLRTTSDQKHSVFTIHCQLTNQRDMLVFSCQKTMLFPFVVPPSIEEVPPAKQQKSMFLEYLVEQAGVLQAKGSQTLSPVRPGQLVLHTLSRPLTLTHTMQLATLARLTHEKHFDTLKNCPEELLVPGGLVLALTSSLTSRDLHECLYEHLVGCSFPCHLSPGDMVSAVTYVQALEEHIGGDIEALCVRTIGIKNCDMATDLSGRAWPAQFFNADLESLRPAVVQELMRQVNPDLANHVVCIADRKIYRQAPRQLPFLL